MLTRRIYRVFVISLFTCISCASASVPQNDTLRLTDETITGTEQLELYIPDIQNKKIALVANHSSMLGSISLVDTLQNLGITISRIFSPEHGFRGTMKEGESVQDETLKNQAISIVSLYGNKKKPSNSDLKDIDILVFDIQDVGVRFYTYITTLTLVMEACAENKIPMIVLDRPNPNGFYIDGPVLDTAFRSFVGMHPVPVVYGLTIGEYAMMVNGEKWLEKGLKCDLKVIPLKNYYRSQISLLHTPPSPNLKSWQAIYLYPSLCFFEGTSLSVGRGTARPFEVYGHPNLMTGSFQFIPAGENTVLENKVCYGQDLSGYANNYKFNPKEIVLYWLIESYNMLSKNDSFFNAYFDRLAGTDQVRKDILSGIPEEKIREKWSHDIDTFKKIRIKYLLYPDFE
ncbi:MAG: exo-beta-N-acetylmuramidase NamZ family protein [Bacteroidales bacterium]